MTQKEKTPAKTTMESFNKVVRKFGDTVSEIFEDPAVRQKAREFSESLVDAAAKYTENKIKDAEVRSKIKNVGKAAQTLGKSLEEQFSKTDSV